ncbi:MAG: hypothetical protein RL215_1899 [Planctomycetota bacterium]
MSGGFAFGAEGCGSHGGAFDIGARASAGRVAVFAEFAAEGAEPDLEDLGGFFAIPVAASERGLDEFAFHFSERHAHAFSSGFLGFVVEPRSDVFRRDAFGDIDCAAAFDGILEFANIPRPWMGFEQPECFSGDLPWWAAFLERDLADEVFDEQWDIVGTDSQRGRLERDPAQMLQEIIAEASFDGEPVKVDMSGGDEADIGSFDGTVQHACSALFEEHREPFLEREGHGIDIIKEDGTTFSHFQIAGEAIRGGVTEELEFEGFDRVEAAVDAEEGFLCAAAAAVKTFCNEGRAAPGFSADEDGAVIISGNSDGFSEGLHGRCTADEVHEIAIEQLSAKFFVFANKFTTSEGIEESGAEAGG